MAHTRPNPDDPFGPSPSPGIPAAGKSSSCRDSGGIPARGTAAIVFLGIGGTALMVFFAIAGGPMTRTQSVQSTTPKGVVCLAFSPDGGTIAIGDRYSRVRFWDSRNLKPTGEIQDHRSQVVTIAYGKDGTLLACGGTERPAFVWDVRTKRIIADLKHQSTVNSLAFSNDGRWLVTGESFRECKARVWDAGTLKPVKSFSVAGVEPVGDFVPGVDYLAISPDSKLLATPGDKQGDVWIWDIEEGVRKYVFHGREDEGTENLEFSPDGKTLAILAARKITLWDFTRSASWRIVPDFCPLAFAFAPDGKHLVAAGSTSPAFGFPGSLGVFNLRDGRQIAGRTLTNHVIVCIGFAPDGDTFATGSVRSDVGLKVWSLKDLLAHPGEPPADDGRP